MDKNMSDRPLWIAAALAVSLGIILMISTIVSLRKDRARLQDYADDMKQLLAEKRLSSEAKGAVQVFEQLANPHPAPIRKLLRNTVGDEDYSSQAPPPKQTINGWQVRQMEISFADIELGKVATFLAKAEAQRPPWRLARCVIHSTSKAGGKGRVSLTLEALDKTR